MTRGRGPDKHPPRKSKFTAIPERAARPFGSQAVKVSGWCYACESPHLWGEACQERRR